MPLLATPAASAGGKGRHDRCVVGRPYLRDSYTRFFGEAIKQRFD